MSELNNNLLDNAPCGYLSFDDMGNILYSNKTLGLLTGYLHGEINGKKLDDLLTIAGKIFLQTHLFPMIIMQRKAEEIFLSLVCSNGETVPVVLNAVRQYEKGVAINTCVLIPVHNRRKYEDELLEARRKAEQALLENRELINAKKEVALYAEELELRLKSQQQTDLERSQFNKVLNHDIQECIRKIILFVNMSEVTDEYTGKVLASAYRLRSITKSLDHLLMLGAENKARSEVDLNLVVNEALGDVKQEHGTVKIEAVFQDLPKIRGYYHDLKLMFYHLFSNAVDFRKNNEVLIGLEQVVYEDNVFRALKNKYSFRDFLQITISDNGMGFSNELSDYVFGMFNKIDMSDRGKLGIGLTICKKIVEEHFGEITLNSTEGKGTSVTIKLPV